MILLLAACGVPDGGGSPHTRDTTTDPCEDLPALTPAPDGYEPVLGDGAMVVFGATCDPNEEPDFTWAIVSAPEGITDDDLVKYQDHEHAEAIVATRTIGTYVVSVIVWDAYDNASAPDFFLTTVSGGNRASVAD